MFIIGKRTRLELQETLDVVLTDPMLKKLHNNLLMGIVANASRDPPPVGGSFSGWNKNKKRKEPMTGRGKSSGRQKRLKMEIMGLGPAERNRIKNFKGIQELDAVWTLILKHLTFRVKRNYIHRYLDLSWRLERLRDNSDYLRTKTFR